MSPVTTPNGKRRPGLIRIWREVWRKKADFERPDPGCGCEPGCSCWPPMADVLPPGEWERVHRGMEGEAPRAGEE